MSKIATIVATLNDPSTMAYVGQAYAWSVVGFVLGHVPARLRGHRS